MSSSLGCALADPRPAGAQVVCSGDTIQLAFGDVCGDITQPDTPSSFVNNDGTAGAVRQGQAADAFSMSAGQIQSLFQGPGRDTFTMSGGVIVGAFEDGDEADFSGGTIGRVDMKLANNIFRMSGGLIQGNLVAGFQNDLLVLTAGRIGGNVSFSGGVDEVQLRGGEIAGDVLLSAGADRFVWERAGSLRGALEMGPDDDQAWLLGLSQATLATPTRFDGGLGQDTMVLSASQAAGLGRWLRWESLQLRDGSSLVLDGDLVLGDEDSRTGALTVDTSSQLRADPAIPLVSIRPLGAGQRASVRNAGLIDLTPSRGQHRLGIQGDYEGLDGRLWLNAVLDDDDSPADRLVVSGGSITGSTQIQVNQIGGSGALTSRNGILLVEAREGTTSADRAFALSRRVQAGAYEYYLFKGGSGGAEAAQSWYLRSSMPGDGSAEAAPLPEGAPALPGTPGGGTGGGGGGASGAVPIHRMEIPVYGALPGAARQLDQLALGTFNQRLGDQQTLRDREFRPATWLRGFGAGFDLRWNEGAEPWIDGNAGGLQLGQDLALWGTTQGAQTRLGLLLGYANSSGRNRGLAFATEGFNAGSYDLNGYSAGLYLNHLTPGNTYLDAVLFGSWLNAGMSSYDGMSESTRGNAWAFSLEAGQPLRLARQLTLEPQLQLIGQSLRFDGFNDAISAVEFEPGDSLLGRFGLRLQADLLSQGKRFAPFLRVDLWQQFAANDGVAYDDVTTVSNPIDSTALQLGLGVDAQLGERVQLYLSGDWITSVSGAYQRTLQGNLGLRFRL